GGTGGRPARAPDVPPGRRAGPRGDREHELPPLPRVRRARRPLRTRRRHGHGAPARRAVPGRDPPGALGPRGGRPPPANRRRRAGESPRPRLPRDRRARAGPPSRGRAPPGAAGQCAVVAGSSVAWAPRPRNDSSSTTATPTLMAESATLNIGQLQPA